METYEDRRRSLYWALRTRVLAGEEMAEVERMDVNLVIEDRVSFSLLDKQRELNEALLQQFRLRLALDEHNAKVWQNSPKVKEVDRH